MFSHDQDREFTVGHVITLEQVSFAERGCGIPSEAVEKSMCLECLPQTCVPKVEKESECSNNVNF